MIHLGFPDNFKSNWNYKKGHKSASNSQYENWGKSGVTPRGESCYAVNQDV